MIPLGVAQDPLKRATVTRRLQSHKRISVTYGGAFSFMWSNCRYFLYSKISPGWQSKALQIASKVEKRIAFAFPFFNIETLAIVMPTIEVSSVTLIFLFASITSMLIMIAIALNG
jgi:hypothetical protein